MLIYRLIAPLLYILILPVLLVLRYIIWRKPTVGILEKLGIKIPKNIKNINKKTIWLHAVSYGEIQTVKEFIKEINILYPDYIIILSTTTSTGIKLASELSQEYKYIKYIFFPFDLYWVIKKYIKLISPEFIIIAETELWAEFLAQAKSNNIPVFLINSRVTESSYKLYKLPVINNFIKNALSAFTRIYAQSKTNIQRYESLGVSSNNLELMNNLKFSTIKKAPKEKINKLQNIFFPEKLNNSITLIASSTHQGEEEIAINSWRYLKTKYPETDIYLILVPRHLERLETIYNYCNSQDIHYNLRTQEQALAPDNILIVNTMGELQAFYALADIVLLGGTWAKIGGHNPLEPLAYNIPVITGEYIFKIQELAEQLNSLELLYITNTEQELNNILENIIDKKISSRGGREEIVGMGDIYKLSQNTARGLAKKINEITDS